MKYDIFLRLLGFMSSYIVCIVMLNIYGVYFITLNPFHPKIFPPKGCQEEIALNDKTAIC